MLQDFNPSRIVQRSSDFASYKKGSTTYDSELIKKSLS